MTSRTPTVPPAARNPHDSKDVDNEPGKTAAKKAGEDAKVSGHDARQRNLKEQGHQGNIAQNTRNQGYQQGR